MQHFFFYNLLIIECRAIARRMKKRVGNILNFARRQVCVRENEQQRNFEGD